MNILCLGGRTTGIAVAWECVKSFLAAKFSGRERHLRRLAKVRAIRTHEMIMHEAENVSLIPESSRYFERTGAEE
jgi:Ribose/Galactose Isomerase